MDSGNAIEVSHITKSFKVYNDKGTSLKDFALFSKRRRFEERVVLDGISFSLKKGEALGLIGENGCGKSTTLKLLTRIMYPDSGSIAMGGRVSSLIELGAGFHPDMSGRENIYINASIFGLTKKEIDARLEDIIDFSELREYIDNPVRTYSSGMYTRLAFSVAINVDADILLIDEILAVGDASFQTKCFNKLLDLKEDGTTIVIVSHSMGQIEQICDKCIWIQDGRIFKEGPAEEICNEYLDYMMNKRARMAELEMLKKAGTAETDYAKNSVCTILFYGRDWNADKYIESGISQNESEFTWTDGKELIFREFDPSREETKTDYRMYVDISGVYEEYQGLIVNSNGREILKTVVFGEKVFEIPVSSDEKGMINISFVLPNAVSPKENSESQDGRQLALKLRSICFTKTDKR